VVLGIVEQVGRTDVGRQRSANEDSLVLRPPFFAVADGMGGARAGEVASAIAADAFEGASAADAAAEAQLARILREANRRIYDLAVTDESRRGMGTTLTAAKVHDEQVSLGHVGDSRAYRMRDGELEQITRDHSLVAELERSGQITPEAAEHHPQRSIITRALGPEPDVEVDTYTLSGRDGDLFLLCSDGLTSMIPDDEVAAILRTSESLDAAADALIKAANQSGGKDNITVVLFRLGEVKEAAPTEATTVTGPPPADDETIAGQLSADEVRREAEGSGLAIEQPPSPPGARLQDLTPSPSPSPPPSRRRRARRRGLVLKAMLGLALVAAALAGLYALSRQVYFVGTNDGGLVTVYRGVPYELPFGIELYEEEYASGMPARAIPDGRRARVLDHEWRSREDAVDLVRALERGQLEDAGAAPN
jgi:protein phosphatase